MKKISLLLCSIILAGTTVSCAENADTPATDTTAPVADTAVETVFDPFAGLPEMDYEGYKFHMLLRPLERWTKDMYVEESEGDIVDDAIFERNSRVSEEYNVVFTYQHSSNSNHETDGKTSILADDDAFDLIMAHGCAAFEYANQKLLLNWNVDLPCINLDAPWWDQDARQNLSINNKLYVMTGDISYCAMGAANVMLFNKVIFDKYNLEYPYQMVRDGKWTYETWDAMARSGSVDLNGDNKYRKDDDQFGYVTQKWVGAAQAFATSGLRVLEKDADDIPYISLNSEKTVGVFNRYFDLIDSNCSYVDTGDVSYSADFITIFNESRALFADMNMHDVIALRGMDADFGIVPWPKYDENAEYCTNVDAGTNMCIVPLTASDPERTSIILESLCAIGYDKVIPAYFDVALQAKASRDIESADMLNIIKAARIFDLGYYNATATGAYAHHFVNFISDTSLGRNFASWYKKHEKPVQKMLDKVIDKYLED